MLHILNRHRSKERWKFLGTLQLPVPFCKLLAQRDRYKQYLVQHKYPHVRSVVHAYRMVACEEYFIQSVRILYQIQPCFVLMIVNHELLLYCADYCPQIHISVCQNDYVGPVCNNYYIKPVCNHSHIQQCGFAYWKFWTGIILYWLSSARSVKVQVRIFAYRPNVAIISCSLCVLFLTKIHIVLVIVSLEHLHLLYCSDHCSQNLMPVSVNGYIIAAWNKFYTYKLYVVMKSFSPIAICTLMAAIPFGPSELMYTFLPHCTFSSVTASRIDVINYWAPRIHVQSMLYHIECF